MMFAASFSRNRNGSSLRSSAPSAVSPFSSLRGYTSDSPITLTNTIIAESTRPGCGRTDVITDGGHNLQFPGTSCGGTIPSRDPRLDPAGLEDNGGPTQTIALLADSPAIDAGDAGVCANPPVNGVDQRGYVRRGEGATNCSIGAYEADGIPARACVGDCDGNNADRYADGHIAAHHHADRWTRYGAGLLTGTRRRCSVGSLATRSPRDSSSPRSLHAGAQ